MIRLFLAYVSINGPVGVNGNLARNSLSTTEAGLTSHMITFIAVNR